MTVAAAPARVEVRRAWWDVTGLVGCQTVALAGSLASLSLLSRALGPATFGLVTVFLSVVHLVFNVAVNWGQSALVRYGKEEVLRTGRLAETFWARQVLMVAGLGGIGLGLLLAREVVRDYLAGAAGLAWAVLPFVVVLAYADLGAWTLQAIGRIGRYGAALVARQSLLLGGALLIASGWVPADVTAALAVEVAGYLALLIVVRAAYAPRLVLPFRVSPTRVRVVWSYSWPVLASLLSGYLVTWFHVIAIHRFLSPQDLGHYQAAFRVIFLVGEGLGAVATVLLPLLVAVQAGGRRRDVDEFYLGRLTPQLAFAWGLVTMALVVLAPLVVPAMFGPAYAPALPVATLLLAGLGAQMPTVMYSVVFSAYGRLRWPMLVAMATGVANVTGLWLVVPRWGLPGAAAVNVVCMLGSTVAYLWAGNRVVGITTWRAALGPGLALTMVLAAVVWSEPAQRLLAFVILMPLAVVWGKRIRLFRLEDLERLQAVAMPRVARRGLELAYTWLS